MEKTLTRAEEQAGARWMITLRRYGVDLVYCGDSREVFHECEGFDEANPMLFGSHDEAMAKLGELLKHHDRLTVSAVTESAA